MGQTQSSLTIVLKNKRNTGWGNLDAISRTLLGDVETAVNPINSELFLKELCECLDNFGLMVKYQDSSENVFFWNLSASWEINNLESLRP